MSAPDLIWTGDNVTLGKERHALVLEALTELGVLCELLRSATRKGSTEEAVAVRGLSIRMGDLIDAVSSAVGDAPDDTADIAHRVGIALPAQEGDA